MRMINFKLFVMFSFHQREYDDEVESRPSFDQISLRRIQEELSKDLSLLKHFEVLLSDRMTSQSTYISAFSPKIRKPTDIMLLPDASINMTINSMYNYLEQVCYNQYSDTYDQQYMLNDSIRFDSCLTATCRIFFI